MSSRMAFSSIYKWRGGTGQEEKTFFFGHSSNKGHGMAVTCVPTRFITSPFISLCFCACLDLVIGWGGQDFHVMLVG